MMQGENDETNEIQHESNQDIEYEGLEKAKKVENDVIESEEQDPDPEGAFGVNDLYTEQTNVDEKNHNYDNNLEFIDKSEMSDEDFKSIKTIDDNINDFEGNELIRK